MTDSKWEYNPQTTNHFQAIAPNLTLVKMGEQAPIYYVMYWGDYSPRFPIRGRFRVDEQKARSDAERILAYERKHGPGARKNAPRE